MRDLYHLKQARIICTHTLNAKNENISLVLTDLSASIDIQEGELFRDKNTNHILQYRHDEGLVHNELLCREITGCINFQQNN